MRVSKSTVRLILLGGMCIYATCTYLQVYDNFYISFLVWGFLVTDSLVSGRIVKRSFSLFSIYLIFTVIMMAIILFFKGSVSQLINYISLLWGILYSVICVNDIYNNFDQDTIEKFSFFQVLVLLISVITTVVFLESNPLAARAVGGVGSGDENVSLLMAKGCGGYGFVFGSLSVAYAFEVRIKNKHGNQFINWICLIIFAYLLFSSNFTTAVITFIIITVYVFIIPENRIMGFILFFVFALGLILFSERIILLLYDFFNFLGLEFFTKKLSLALVEGSSSGFYITASRYERFMISIDSFISNPLFGGMKTGGHSVFFDLLASIGLFSILTITCFIQLFSYYLPSIEKKALIGLVMIFILVGMLDTFFHPAQIVMSFIISPLLMITKKSKRR